MNMLVVPKPLFTSDMQVRGYYLSFQYGNAILESTKSNPFDRAMNSPFIDFMNEVGLDALTQNNLIFVPITQILLFTELDKVCAVDQNKVVLLLDATVENSPEIVERLVYYHRMGFKLAARYKGDIAAIKPFIPHLDYIFLQVNLDDISDAVKKVRREAPRVQLVAPDIESKMLFDSIKHGGIHLFDGAFYKVHVTTSSTQNALSPLKVNYIQLLNIVNQEDFDFQAFTRIVRQDTAMAIQFMRLVNSSGRSDAEIKNLNQAAAMLGQREIKKWVSTAVSNSLCADKPSEITRLSLLRAKFCENLSKLFEMGMLQENLFLLGLFSVLDVVLDMPIEDALDMVFVPTPIRDALIDNKGELFDVLSFVMEYEFGHWKEISRQALVRNISIDDIYTAYLDSQLWYSNLISLPEQAGDI